MVQDNDPKHTAKITKAWMRENMPQNTLDWPSQSPDVNPIENLFAWLKQELIKRSPVTLNALKGAILEFNAKEVPTLDRQQWL